MRDTLEDGIRQTTPSSARSSFQEICASDVVDEIKINSESKQRLELIELAFHAEESAFCRLAKESSLGSQAHTNLGFDVREFEHLQQ